MTLHGISIPEDRLAPFCRVNGIRRLALFGSILREDFGPNSDIDILVEFLPTGRVGDLAIARMTREIAAMLGRTVDVRTPAELHPAFREQVLKEALNEYVAA